MSTQFAGILFLCVGNSCRSQMAEGLARSMAPPGTPIYSAGSRPEPIRPETLVVMTELGLDIAGQRSKGIPEIITEPIDVVITLCNEEVCPVFPGKVTKHHWPIPDPAGLDLVAYRAARDEIAGRLRKFFGQVE